MTTLNEAAALAERGLRWFPPFVRRRHRAGVAGPTLDCRILSAANHLWDSPPHGRSNSGNSKARHGLAQSAPFPQRLAVGDRRRRHPTCRPPIRGRGWSTRAIAAASREVFTAAGGARRLGRYDRVMAGSGARQVLITPTRIYGNG